MGSIRQGRFARRGAASLLTGVTMVGVLFLTSCYVYVPAASPPPPGEMVRLSLGEDAQRRISAQAERRINSLEGRVVSAGPDSISVAARLAPGSQVGPRTRLHQVFTVARSEVVQIQGEEFSRKRTALLGGAILAAVVTVIQMLSANEGGDPGDRPPTFPEAPFVGPGTAIPTLHR